MKLVLPNGDIIAEKPINELYKARWRPMPGVKFVKRPLPKPRQLTEAELKLKEESETPYVPPHLRGARSSAPAGVVGAAPVKPKNKKKNKKANKGVSQ